MHPPPAAMRWDVAHAPPAIKLASVAATAVPWALAATCCPSGPRRTLSSRPSPTAATLRFGDDRHGRRPAAGTASLRPTASATARAATSAPTRSRTSSPPIASSPACATAAGDGRRGAREDRARAPHRAVAFRMQQRAVTPDDYARWPSAIRGAARGRDVPLDGQLAHGLRHRRPARGAGPPSSPSMRVCWFSSSPSAWPATTSRSMRRASCRSTSPCWSARGATISAPTSSGRCWRCSAPRAARRPPRALPSRQLQLRPAGVSLATLRGRQAVDGVDSVEVTAFQRRDSRTRGPRGRPLDFGRLEIARSTTTRLSRARRLPFEVEAAIDGDLDPRLAR